MNLGKDINHSEKGKPHIYFVGQAGFVFVSSKGTKLGIDLYLSDCVERFDGFKRLLPYVLQPDEVEFDFLISTHAHLDHFDIDSIPILLKEKTELFATENCKLEAKKININLSKLNIIKYLDKKNLRDFSVDFVFADHGDSAPDAVGLVIKFDNYNIYITGDTRLRLDKIEELRSYGPFDLMITAINGAFGNLDSTEAAVLTSLIKPKMVIPCHYWNFIEHLSNPIVFREKMNLYDSDIKVQYLRPGEELEFDN
jgi:L-ascorbate 6-phosphate lactonase